MIALAIVTALLALAIWWALTHERRRPLHGFVGWPGFDGIHIAASPYVPPGTMLLFGPDAMRFDHEPPATFASNDIDISFRPFVTEQRISLQVNDPKAFVNIVTGI